MSAGNIALLGLQGIVFAAWAWLVFRTLFRLYAMAREGSVMPGPSRAVRIFRTFATAPAHARDRRRLVVLTCALFAVSVLGTALRFPGAAQ